MAVIADAVGAPTAVKVALATQFTSSLAKYASLPQMVALITAMQTAVNAQLDLLVADGVTTKVNVRLSGSAQGPATQSKSTLANNMNIQLTINPSYK